MNRIKLFLISLAVLSFYFTMISPTLAASKVGLVDMAVVVQNYDKAKQIQEDFQTKQAKLKKMIDEARDEVSKIEEEEARKATEKKLTEKILKENDAVKDDFTKKWQEVQTNILTSIRTVAQKGKYDMIINKQSVITGGEDITDKVLTDLQSKADSADKAKKSK